MALRLTPEVLAAAYDYLRSTPPFRRWRRHLPPSDEVSFYVVRDTKTRGWHRLNGSHEVAVNERWVGHTATLMEVMAHEMVHVYQEDRGSGRAGVQHNAEFVRLAGQVCRHHGFDPRSFM